MRPAAYLLLCPVLLFGCKGDGEDSDPGTADDTTAPADDTSPDTDQVGDAVVVVSGDVYVLVGTSVELSASTANGEDASYTWSSSDEAAATVDAGMVSALRPGQVTITATGDTTGASGSMGLYIDTEIPHYDEWAASGHADYDAEAFNHWNDEGEVEIDCARCHSSGGFQDYIGADGTKAFSVDGAAELGTVIDCTTCHNDTANDLSTVIFPSGVQLDELGGEARCMTCHQGRESKASVDTAIADVKLGDSLDTVSKDLGFENIHFYPAAATLYAAEVLGGYQYDDKVYDYKFRHVSERTVCIECHDPHSLEVQVDDCAECHEGVKSADDLKDVRMMSSLPNDYDGDGDLEEGLYYEIDGLKGMLLTAIQGYADQMGAGICYDGGSYPYWFHDTDGSGDCNDKEPEYGNKYSSWTGRLLMATYNYQMVSKDPGGFAHNGKYLIELLYDSIEDLNSVLKAQVDLSSAVRTDQGHFNGAGDAARHWDDDDDISSSCSSCHGGVEGFDFYLQYGTGLEEMDQANGLECETCHEDAYDYALKEIESVTFPSDVEHVFDDSTDNLCVSCHRGRESGADVDADIAEALAEGSSLSFVNPHYLPAGAIKLGSVAAVGYEWDGMDYAGEHTGHTGGDACMNCHSANNTEHTFNLEDNWDQCNACHVSADELGDLRSGHADDYDGDGDASEPLADELGTLSDALMAAMVAQANAEGSPFCYSESAYPYFFNDDGDGTCSDDEAQYSNQYTGWSADVLRASFNWKLVSVEPGAWAHNFDYSAQLLIDSIDALGGDVSGYTRPAAE